MESFCAGGNRKDAEAVKTKTRAVNPVLPRSFVCKEFTIHRSLTKVCAFDWHRAPVGFKEEVNTIYVADLINVFQRKYAVRNDAEAYIGRHMGFPPKWLRLPVEFIPKKQICLIYESNVVILSAREFKCDHDIR